MKAIKLAILAALIACAGIVVADDSAPKVSGSFTNTSLSVTNTTGRKWLQSVAVWGTFTTSSNAIITLKNGSTNPFELYNSSSVTNTALSRIHGTIPWERLGVITFNVGSNGTNLNEYAIESTVEPR